MTHKPQPQHIDADYAAKSEFGQILVNGTFTFALMVGLSVGDTTLGTLVANLGYDKLVMPKHVFLGDTLRARTEVADLKDSKSRPGSGIEIKAMTDHGYPKDFSVGVTAASATLAVIAPVPVLSWLAAANGAAIVNRSAPALPSASRPRRWRAL